MKKQKRKWKYILASVLLDKAKALGLGSRTDQDVADDLGYSRERIRKLRIQFKIPKAPGAGIQRVEKRDRIISLIREGKTISQVAFAMEMSRGRVRELLHRNKIRVINRDSRRKYSRETVVQAINASDSLVAASKLLKLNSSSQLHNLISEFNLRSDPAVVIPDGRKKKK